MRPDFRASLSSAGGARCPQRAGGARARQPKRVGDNALHRGRFGASFGAAAFSLIEVLAAVAIFAIGMVAVLALFAPVTTSVARITDAETAARVADGVRARLRALPFDAALAQVEDAATVKKNDADGAYNPNDGTKHPAVIFGKANGEVGFYDPTVTPKGWYSADFTGTAAKAALVADADKFFEIDLIRNDTLSPKAADPTAALVAYTMRVRWPAFLPGANGTAVQTGTGSTGAVTFDQSKKQVLFFPGVITR